MLALSQRRATLAILLLLLGASILTTLIAVFVGNQFFSLGGLIGTLIYGGLFFAYRRGWEWIRHAMVVIITILVGVASILYVQMNPIFIPAIFVPPIVALMTVRPLEVFLSGVGALLLPIVGLGLTAANPYAEPLTAFLSILIVIGIVLARLVLDTHRLSAERAAEAANQAQRQAEVEADIARKLADERSQEVAAKQRLLDLVDILETPAIGLADDVLLVPLIGSFDRRRMERMTNTLLQNIHARRTARVILDATGLTMIDTAIAQALLQLHSAIQLLGCKVTITGMSSAIASTLTHLGVELVNIETAHSVQEALYGHVKPRERVI